MGGLIAFELAQSLKYYNHALPNHIIISRRGAVHLAQRHKKLATASVNTLIKELIKYDELLVEVLKNSEYLEIFAPIIQADFSISESAQALSSHKLLDCPISVFGGKTDPYVLEQDIIEWKKYTLSQFHYYLFEGGHFFWQKKSYNVVITAINNIISKEVKNFKRCVNFCREA